MDANASCLRLSNNYASIITAFALWLTRLARYSCRLQITVYRPIFLHAYDIPVNYKLRIFRSRACP